MALRHALRRAATGVRHALRLARTVRGRDGDTETVRT
jgi:hypothetical protein